MNVPFLGKSLSCTDNTARNLFIKQQMCHRLDAQYIEYIDSLYWIEQPAPLARRREMGLERRGKNMVAAAVTRRPVVEIIRVRRVGHRQDGV